LITWNIHIKKKIMYSIKKCPYCESSDKILLGTQTHNDKYLELIDTDLNKQERHWYKCEKCDFIYRSPVIDHEEAEILYSKYRSFDFRKITPSDYFEKMTSIPENKSETYEKAKFIKENVQNIHSILDIGCGGGIFLYQLNKLFPNSYILGLEPNSDYAKMVRDKMNIDIIEDFYKKDNIDRIFDLTVSTDVIEHIHDLEVFWKGTINNVQKGKYLFLEVPSVENFDSIDVEDEIFEAPHIYFFYKKHILQLANRYDFELVNSKNMIVRNKYKKDLYLFKKKG